MKQSIFHPAAAEGIVARIAALTPDTRRQWGTMNATEMLRHCNVANDFTMEEEAQFRKSGLKQRAIKFLAIRLLPRFPKNHKGPARVTVKGTVDAEAFEAEKQRYITTVRRYTERSKPITAWHPSMGCLSNEEWGIVVWMHMDHHLRQFGL